MKFTLFSFISIFLPSISQTNEIKMIIDVLGSFNKPSNVVAHLCWDSFKKKHLMSAMTALDKPKTIQFVRNVNAEKLSLKETIVFLIDVTCPDVTIFLDQANVKRMFGKPYRWLVMGNSINDGIPSELDDLPILTDSEVYVTKTNGNDSFIINLVYKIKLGRGWITEYYGTWTANGIIKSRLDEISAAIRRKNLAGESLGASVVIYDNSSLTDFDDLRYPLIDSQSKSVLQLLIPLFYFMNATRKLMFVQSWGLYSNGTWNGMFGDIADGRAEIAGSYSFMSTQRLEIMEYLSYPTPIFLKFIFREPPLSYQSNLFLLPFKATVWYCVGVFVVVMIVVILVNAKWEAKKRENSIKTDHTALAPNIGDVTVFVVGAITQQGNSTELKGTLGRLVIFILLMAFLFLYTAYSASIVVLLQSSSNQIRTLTDLFNSKLELGVEDTTYNRYWFSVADEPIKKAIYEKKIAPKDSKPRFYPLVEGIRLMQNQPFAFHVNLGVGYHIMEKYFHEHEKCGLQEIKFVQNSSPWTSCSKRSPYKEMFKIGFLRINEHGLNVRINNLIYAKRPVCSVKGGRFVSVSLVDFYPSLLVLLYGLIFSLVLLVIEILYYKKCTEP